MSDVFCAAGCSTSSSVKWDSIAVIEELSLFDKRLEVENESRIDFCQHWGPNYFVDMAGVQPMRNFFVLEAAKVARYAVPFVRNIELIM